MGIPLTALSINTQQPSPLDEYQKIQGLRGLQQEQQSRALQQQQQQQQIKSTDLDIQQKELALKNNQVRQSVLSDPGFSKDFSDWQSQKSGSQGTSETPGAQPASGTVPLHPLAQYLAEKRGLPLFGPGGAIETSEQLTTGAQKIAELAKTQGEAGTAMLNNHSKQLDNFNNLAEPILSETDPAKQAHGLQMLQSELQQHPEMYPQEAVQHVGSLNTIQGLQTAANTSKVKQMLVEDATKQSEASSAASTATQKQEEIAKPTPEQLDTFTKKTLPSFSNMMPAQRAAYAAQASQARTVPEFNKVVEQADATEKAQQLHADTLANTKAIMGNKFGEQGLTANEKIWTDPQRGFAGALAQANQTKNSIQAGVDGNALLTNMVPTMEVLGINHAAGISRISPQEALAAGTSPDWATRWNAWATKAATGKLTPELAKQGQELMNIVVDAAHTRAVQSSQLIAKGHGLTPDQVPAMDMSGNITTLDKVGGAQGGGQKPQSNAASPTKEQPVYHEGKLLGYTQDGKTISRLP